MSESAARAGKTIGEIQLQELHLDHNSIYESGGAALAEALEHSVLLAVLP